MSTGPKGRLGYRLFQPLFHGDADDIASRQKNITGFFCVDLDIGESVSKAFKDIPPVGIDVWVSDITDTKDVTVCRHSSRLSLLPINAGELSIGNELESTWRMDFFDRKLMIHCCSTPAFWTGHTIWEPWLLLCIGLALTLTVSGYKLSMAFRAAAIERTVEARIDAVRQDFEQHKKAKEIQKQASPPIEDESPKLEEPI